MLNSDVLVPSSCGEWKMYTAPDAATEEDIVSTSTSTFLPAYDKLNCNFGD
jgi:hypothetical protein